MLRVIAYGDELNLAHPPRPKDPKAKWEPVWAVKLRVKSVASGMLGADGGSGDAGREQEDEAREDAATDAEGYLRPLDTAGRGAADIR
jgi:hypothetical protein